MKYWFGGLKPRNLNLRVLNLWLKTYKKDGDIAAAKKIPIFITDTVY